MSKINPTQLAALQSPATPVAKATTKKVMTTKTSSTKTAIAKPTEKATEKIITKATAKPAAAAKKPVTKPAATKAKVTLKATAKDTSKDKPRKSKMERDSFTMPKDEYAQIALMKSRLLALGQPTKKSELLRAGVKLLAAMSDATLKSTLAAIPVIKTGRPNKH